jgi:hypothetical protein
MPTPQTIPGETRAQRILALARDFPYAAMTKMRTAWQLRMKEFVLGGVSHPFPLFHLRIWQFRSKDHCDIFLDEFGGTKLDHNALRTLLLDMGS